MRFNLSAWALQHRTLTLLAMIVLAAGGALSYLSLGRAEDPAFTIKQMVIQADWPGASADEMSRQVTDRIERKLQELQIPGTDGPGLPPLDFAPPRIQ